MKNLNFHTYLKIWTFLLMIAVLFFVTSSPIAQETESSLSLATSNKKFESQLEELINTVYCPCGCVRETIKVCVCQTANSIEAEFVSALTDGKTVEEIRTAYLEQYGTQFHAVMKAEGVNILAYLMPAVILIAIGGVIFGIRHRSRENKVTIQPDKQISDELQQHLESELDKYKNQN